VLKWYQEPLLHFLVLGALLFIFTQNSSNFNRDKKNITVSKTDTENYIRYWKKKYNRPPTQEEIDTFLKITIENEVLYKEALNMGLDKEDKVIKQHLIDKLKFIISKPIDEKKISDKTLKKFFEKNRNLFSSQNTTLYSFAHIYLNPKYNDNIELKADEIYIKIKDEKLNNNYTKLGDKFYKGSYFNQLSIKDISKIFSRSFAKKLSQLPQGEWIKGVASGYGVHLIYIEEKNTPKDLFESQKERVKNRYIIQESQKKLQNFYESLKKKYHITIEPYSLNESE
jgi:hypothetical protein